MCTVSCFHCPLPNQIPFTVFIRTEYSSFCPYSQKHNSYSAVYIGNENDYSTNIPMQPLYSEEKTHIMLIFRFIILLWVITWKGLHALMFSKNITFLILSIPVCLRSLPNNTQSALIGRLALSSVIGQLPPACEANVGLHFTWFCLKASQTSG